MPETQGYGLLAVNTAITDRGRVPTVYGGTADLGRYPLRRGHEDGVQFMCDPAKEFAFTSVAFPSRGYLYFNLKDPRVLCSTVFWMCDGGRYGAPFSGRATGVLGAEEVTGYFFSGIRPSVEANPLQQKGFRTYLDFSASKPVDVRLIMGVAPIGSGFAGVQGHREEGRFHGHDPRPRRREDRRGLSRGFPGRCMRAGACRAGHPARTAGRSRISKK